MTFIFYKLLKTVRFFGPTLYIVQSEIVYLISGDCRNMVTEENDENMHFLYFCEFWRVGLSEGAETAVESRFNAMKIFVCRRQLWPGIAIIISFIGWICFAVKIAWVKLNCKIIELLHFYGLAKYKQLAQLWQRDRASSVMWRGVGHFRTKL